MINKFLEDAYFELNGYDMDQIKKERQQIIEQEKASTIIFKNNTKRLITVFGILMIVVAALSCYYDFKTGNRIEFYKYLLLSILEILTLILLWIKTKKSEVASAVGMALIVIFNFVILSV